jgi:hypothetical protein
MYEILGYGVFCSIVFLLLFIAYFFAIKPRSLPNVPYFSALWAWNLAGIVNSENRSAPYVYGGGFNGPSNVRQHKKILKEWWGITSKDELFSAIEALSDGDVHHKEFCSRYASILLNQEKEYDPYLVALLKENKDHVEEKGIIAWDLVRLQSLCGWGYMAGYLTYDEAATIAVQEARKTQEIFSSWDDMARNYMIGYTYWCNDGADARSREKIAHRLLKGKFTPWRKFKWDYSFHKAQLNLDEALKTLLKVDQSDLRFFLKWRFFGLFLATVTLLLSLPPLLLMPQDLIDENLGVFKILVGSLFCVFVFGVGFSYYVFNKLKSLCLRKGVNFSEYMKALKVSRVTKSYHHFG